MWCYNEHATTIEYRIVNRCDRTVMKDNIEIGDRKDVDSFDKDMHCDFVEIPQHHDGKGEECINNLTAYRLQSSNP